MSNVVKMSEAASLGLHAMVVLAEEPDRSVSIKEIVESLDVSGAHLSKVLQRLVRAGLLNSTRGPYGGFTLGRPSNKITLLDVYESIEGPLVPSKCLFSTPRCDGRECILGGLLENVNREVRDHLAGTTLADLDHIDFTAGAEGKKGEEAEKRELGLESNNNM